MHIIECFPTRILGNTIEISSQDSYIQVINDEKNIPLSSSLDTKIKDIEISNKPIFYRSNYFAITQHHGYKH